MEIHKLSIQDEITEKQKESLHLFFKEFTDLCNKHRITFNIGTIFFLRNEIVDGKLLDVAGFTYDKDKQMSYPVFVNVLEEKNETR